jgi:hypothetical protein
MRTGPPATAVVAAMNPLRFFRCQTSYKPAGEFLESGGRGNEEQPAGEYDLSASGNFNRPLESTTKRAFRF